jgi:hypothetical protein
MNTGSNRIKIYPKDYPKNFKKREFGYKKTPSQPVFMRLSWFK